MSGYLETKAERLASEHSGKKRKEQFLADGA